VPLARYLGIHRFSCDRDRAAPAAARGVLRKGTTNESREAPDGRARQNVPVTGEEKAVEREPGQVAPVGSKGPFEANFGRGKPHERSGDEISPAWFWAEQVVERVRNPEDERCRRLDPPGYGRLILSSAVGDRTPGEVHSPAQADAVEE